MVQLNTTYDSKLKGKVFVLKGEEAYARTTDTVAELISDFEDCNTHFSYTRVGLQIRVLRAIGDGLITIYIDGNEQEPIPYNPSKMNQLIDSDFNAKGVYWIDDSLIIGNPSNSDTGYHVDYNIEHSIKVVYSSTDKLCLGSESETILFEHERPDTLVSSLSFGSTPTYVDSVYPTGVATITGTIELECEYDVEEEQRNVYLVIDDLGIRELVEVYPNTPTSFELTGVSEGLQSIRAVFDGDYEILDCTKTLDVSVGCKVVVSAISSSSVINDENVGYNVKVLDYLSNPVSGTVSPVYCQSVSESIDGMKQITLSKSEYSQMMGQNPNIASNIIDMTTMFTKSETAKYLNVPIGSEDAYGLEYYDNVTVSLSYDEVICLGRTTPITATFTSNGNPVPNLRTNLTIDGSTGVVRTDQDGKVTFNYIGFGKGAFEISTNRPVHSETFIDYDRYWSRNPNIVNKTGYKTGGASLEQTNDSFLLQSTAPNKPSWIEFETNTDSSSSYRYAIEFTITSLNGFTKGNIGFGKTHVNPIEVSVGSVVRITKSYDSSQNRTLFFVSAKGTITTYAYSGNVNISWGLIDDNTVGFNKLKGWFY